MESLSKDFVSDQAPSTASDFVHITNAGDGDLLLRPWSQRNQKAFQRKPSLEGNIRSTNAKKISSIRWPKQFSSLISNNFSNTRQWSAQ